MSAVCINLLIAAIFCNKYQYTNLTKIKPCLGENGVSKLEKKDNEFKNVAIKSKFPGKYHFYNLYLKYFCTKTVDVNQVFFA